jgi:hypothetical protein
MEIMHAIAKSGAIAAASKFVGAFPRLERGGEGEAGSWRVGRLHGGEGTMDRARRGHDGSCEVMAVRVAARTMAVLRRGRRRVGRLHGGEAETLAWRILRG